MLVLRTAHVNGSMFVARHATGAHSASPVSARATSHIDCARSFCTLGLEHACEALAGMLGGMSPRVRSSGTARQRRPPSYGRARLRGCF